MDNNKFALPKGYGQLVETMKITTKGVDGTLFVHEHEGNPDNHVASLQVRVGDSQVTYKYLWQPKTEKVSQKGSTLRFRNVPNSTASPPETWESPAFQERKVEIYENKDGKFFAILPQGILNLERRARASTFDAQAFTQAATKMRAAVQANKGQSPSTSTTEEPDVVLTTIRNADPAKGISVEDIAAQCGIDENTAETAVQILVDNGTAKEVTLGCYASA
jgi:hypothetical protein